jgi:phage terminase large subunit-like protein
MSISKNDVVYVEHLYFEKGTPLQREEAMVRIAQQDAERGGMNVEIWHQQDPGTSGLDSAQMTNMNLAKAGFIAHFETVTGNKETTRPRSWSSACEAGRVRLVRGAWNDGFIERHVGFPKHRYDDDVDAASWGFAKLASAVRMSPEKCVAWV